MPPCHKQHCPTKSLLRRVTVTVTEAKTHTNTHRGSDYFGFLRNKFPLSPKRNNKKEQCLQGNARLRRRSHPPRRRRGGSPAPSLGQRWGSLVPGPDTGQDPGQNPGQAHWVLRRRRNEVRRAWSRARRRRWSWRKRRRRRRRRIKALLPLIPARPSSLSAGIHDCCCLNLTLFLRFFVLFFFSFLKKKMKEMRGKWKRVIWFVCNEMVMSWFSLFFLPKGSILGKNECRVVWYLVLTL